MIFIRKYLVQRGFGAGQLIWLALIGCARQTGFRNCRIGFIPVCNSVQFFDA